MELKGGENARDQSKRAVFQRVSEMKESERVKRNEGEDGDHDAVAYVVERDEEEFERMGCFEVARWDVGEWVQAEKSNDRAAD